ncbi:MAG: MarC family protein [Pyrobaculum sp.]
MISIIVLYTVVDPIGNIPLFLAATSRLDADRRRRVLLLSVLIASLVLTVFATFGAKLFLYFGVTAGDFMVASGLVLTVFSLLYLLKPYEQGVGNEVEVAAVPLAVPFLAGPASISYVLLLSSEKGPIFALAVVAVVSALTLATLMASEKMIKLLGILGVRVIEKIMLILSVAIGVSLIRRGLETWRA